MPRQTYDLIRPRARDTSVVFASPHSGRDYGDSFLRRACIDPLTLRSSEDAFVDQLFSAAPLVGAPLLLARAPRAYVDLNRSPDELDPAVIDGARPVAHNPRIASGLGVVPRVVSGARAIYRGKLSMAEARRRIDSCWHPYHRTLQTLLDESLQMFGQAILIDCHSMPHEAMDGIARRGAPRPDVVLGDRFGASACSDLVDQVEEAFRAAGLNTVRNSPFAGAFVAQHYGRPSRNQHVIQIEIDRALYMDERLIRPTANFAALQHSLSGVIARVAAIGRADALPLAAE